MPNAHATKLNSIPSWMADPATVSVMTALNENGDEARFVGGCVRDSLINKTSFDIDIATIWTPDQVMARLKSAQIKAIPTGIDHGTVTAVVDNRPFEITTLRHDVKTDGRHAEVSFTTDWSEDAKRRDFTMNSIFCDMNGYLYDPVGGISDLHQGIVRFVGDAPARIAEDYLRILRYFRFWAHYGRQDPDPETLQACANQADQLSHLSIERITTETLKLLNSDNAPKTWELMLQHNVMDHILPMATQTVALSRLIHFEHNLDDKRDSQSPADRIYSIRRLAALLCDQSPEVIKQIAKKMRLSNKQAHDLSVMSDQNLIPDFNITDTDIRRLVYQFNTDTVRNILLVTGARLNVATDVLQPFYHAATTTRLPRFPLTGQDAMALGLEGVEIGQALQAAENWWIEQDFKPGRTACLEQLEQNVT